MIKKVLSSLENPAQPLLGPNYWSMSKAWLIIPDTWFAKFISLLFNTFGTLFLLAGYTELYLVRMDIEEAMSNMMVSFFSVVTIAKGITCVCWQKEWRRLLDYITESDKFERYTLDARRRNIVNSYTKYCRKVTYCYWIFAFFTAIGVLITPVIKYCSLDGETRNGTDNFPHLFSTWMPFDKNHFPGNLITVAAQLFIMYYGSMNTISYDTTVVVILVFFRGKLDLLCERSKHVLGRDGKGISNEELIKRCRELHEIHVQLTEYFRLFDSLISPIMFIYVILHSVSLCAIIYILTVTSGIRQLMVAQFLAFAVAQLFLFCWHASTVAEKSQRLSYGPYESEWWIANVRQRKMIHLLTGRFRIRHFVSAGPFTDLSVSTFVTILKGAYSYYTLLRDVKSRH